MLFLYPLYIPFLDFVMSSLLPSYSIFGSDVDPITVLFTVVSIPAIVLAYPVSVYFITRWRLESEYKSAILMSESFLPVLKKREGPQDPQAQNVSPSVEYAVSIARWVASSISLLGSTVVHLFTRSFFMSASAALSELDNNFPWRRPKVRKAVVTAKNDAAVMLRLRDVGVSPCSCGRHI